MERLQVLPLEVGFFAGQRFIMRMFSRCSFFVTWIWLVVGLAACAAGPEVTARPGIKLPPFGAATGYVFVASNGWHSSIVISRDDIPQGRIPEAEDFPKARFLEFGWGDAEYFPAKRATIGMTLSAALVPTPSVLHVAGLSVTPGQQYPQAEVIVLSLDEASLGRLVNFIDASFERAGQTRVNASGSGLYPTSRFYPATGWFHLLNTCNTWTARGLVAAGFPVNERNAMSAEDLMVQVRQLGGQVPNLN